MEITVMAIGAECKETEKGAYIELELTEPVQDGSFIAEYIDGEYINIESRPTVWVSAEKSYELDFAEKTALRIEASENPVEVTLVVRQGDERLFYNAPRPKASAMFHNFKKSR